MYIMLLILTKSYGTNKCLYVKTLLYTSLYPDYTRDALAPYLLHSQVPLTEESTALIRSKSYIHARSQATISEAICIPKKS